MFREAVPLSLGPGTPGTRPSCGPPNSHLRPRPPLHLMSVHPTNQSEQNVCLPNRLRRSLPPGPEHSAARPQDKTPGLRVTWARHLCPHGTSLTAFIPPMKQHPRPPCPRPLLEAGGPRGRSKAPHSTTLPIEPNPASPTSPSSSSLSFQVHIVVYVAPCASVRLLQSRATAHTS